MSTKTLFALLRLLRPLNLLLSLPVVVLGGVCANRAALADPALVLNLVLAALVTALALGAGNVRNDLEDQAEDRINRPGRPLPSGAVTVSQARALALLLMFSSLAAAGVLSVRSGQFRALAVALVCLGLLELYARRGKQWPGAGNLLVALLAALAVWYGSWAVAPAWVPGGLSPALGGFSFGVTWVRELLKDGEDRLGDQASGRRTLTLLLSPAGFRTCVVGVFCLLPLLAGSLALDPESRTLALLLLLPLGLGVWALWQWDPRREQSAGQAQRRFRTVMLLGMAVFAIHLLNRI